jgi:hypothetical protein
VDPFWDGKDYVTARESHRFACETVPLARLTKRIWTNDETFTADIEIAHFGPEPRLSAEITWRLMRGESVYQSGKFSGKPIPIGNRIQLGRAESALDRIAEAVKMKLIVHLEDTDFENDWDIWVYPKLTEPKRTPDIHITGDLDDEALSILESGGKVMLMPSEGSIKGDVALGFSSIF